MTFISNLKLKAKHAQTPLDIYYSNLEEAYGNLPVPDDDWAGVTKLLKKKFLNEDIETHIEELQQATELIARHYEMVAQALGKEQKYG